MICVTPGRTWRTWGRGNFYRKINSLCGYLCTVRTWTQKNSPLCKSTTTRKLARTRTSSENFLQTRDPRCTALQETFVCTNTVVTMRIITQILIKSFWQKPYLRPNIQPQSVGLGLIQHDRDRPSPSCDEFGHLFHGAEPRLVRYLQEEMCTTCPFTAPIAGSLPAHDVLCMMCTY